MFHTVHSQNACRLYLRHHSLAAAERTLAQRGGVIAPMTAAEDDWYSPLLSSTYSSLSSTEGDTDPGQCPLEEAA